MGNEQKFTSRQARWISPAFFALVFYVVGASFMDAFAIYHTWRFVGAAEFVTMHIESGSRIIPFMVIPAAVMSAFVILQFWHRAIAVPRWQVWVCVACVTIPWLSSAFIQIPMQFALDQGKNEQLLNDLIVTDWIRVIPTIVLALTTFSMIRKTIGS